jgi:long-chain acyl-CoA synthetase
MLIRGGENVYCAEVESALFEHDDVVGAAVFGVPHRVLGEEVAAQIQVRRGALCGEGELREFVSERLAKFKIPAHWWISEDDLPLNANGKVLKTELRERALRQLGGGGVEGVVP